MNQSLRLTPRISEAPASGMSPAASPRAAAVCPGMAMPELLRGSITPGTRAREGPAPAFGASSMRSRGIAPLGVIYLERSCAGSRGGYGQDWAVAWGGVPRRGFKYSRTCCWRSQERVYLFMTSSVIPAAVERSGGAGGSHPAWAAPRDPNPGGAEGHGPDSAPRTAGAPTGQGLRIWGA